MGGAFKANRNASCDPLYPRTMMIHRFRMTSYSSTQESFPPSHHSGPIAFWGSFCLFSLSPQFARSLSMTIKNSHSTAQQTSSVIKPICVLLSKLDALACKRQKRRASEAGSEWKSTERKREEVGKPRSLDFLTDKCSI